LVSVRDKLSMSNATRHHSSASLRKTAGSAGTPTTPALSISPCSTVESMVMCFACHEYSGNSENCVAGLPSYVGHSVRAASACICRCHGSSFHQ